MAEVTGMTPEKIDQEISNVKSYVDGGLSEKADAAQVSSDLSKKANTTYVDSELSKKADATYVNSELSKKADVTDVNSELSKKADKNQVASDLSTKADITYVDSLSPLKSFAGTGSPEGKITAPVGTIYSDTAATNGAIRWIKAIGTGKTGWVVEYGDTGWRDMSSLLPSHMTGTILFRRQNNSVTLLLAYISGLTDSVTLTIPDTAAIRAHYMEVAIANARTTERQLFRVNPAANHVLNANGTNQTANGSVSWVTNSPWPTSLPGTPH